MKTYLRHQLIPFFLAYLGKWILKATLFTCKIEANGLSQFLTHTQKQKCILALWHNRLPIITEIFEKFTSTQVFAGFISNSKDGEVAAILTESYPRGKAVRVPHNQKKAALAKVIQRVKLSKEIPVITPDGPRGPRYQAKPGAVIISQETSVPIIPFSWTASSFWQFSTWDKMLFPKPFSTIVVSWGEPFFPENTSILEEKLLLHDKFTCQKLSQNPFKWPK